MSDQPQSFENHGKMVPAFHRWMTAFLVLPTLYFMFRVVSDFYSVERIAIAFFSVGVIIAALFGRLFALGVQDRVIRLEERLRMQMVLPDDLKGRIQEFTTNQLVGLRFASDDELPALARRVLDEGISDRKVIKQAVQNWRADHQRI
jgi:hypothetical protein